AVTGTLTQLVDSADNTTTLDIHSTVAVLDTRLTPHLGAETGALDYAHLFDLLDDKGNSRFTGLQGITIVGDKIYLVRTHSDWVYDETTGTGQDVESNVLYLVERDTDGKLYMTKSAEITGLTGAAQVRVSSDGSSLYVIGADNIALFDANDLHQIGTVGGDIGMVRDVLANGDKVYITSGDSLLVFTRTGETLTLTTTLTDAGDTGQQLDGANALTLSPDGKTLFVATSGGDTVVSRFSVSDDGTLTYKQAIAGSTASEEGYYASAITVSPDGKSLYVVDNNTSLHIFTVAQDGTLTATSTLTISSGEGDEGKPTSVKQVLVSPDGSSVVITGELGRSDNYNTYGIILYARAADGSLTQRQAVEGFGNVADYKGTVLSEVRYASFSADGKQLYLTGTLYIQDSTSGSRPEGMVILDLIPATETFTERGDAVALLPGGILSAPVNDQSSYQGATLVIERTGGAQAGDQFGLSAGSGLTLTEDGKISQGGKAIANVTIDTSGKLTITFLAGVTQAEAQQVLRAIA
ncbi:PD40 domain-containing protein, partial [Candidatus Symbiopectobacterium sp. NZEC135]|nr:PD40 domain-containing protein [Candidatus Symbiopectobacterium sp. NZEC135]